MSKVDMELSFVSIEVEFYVIVPHNDYANWENV